MALRGALPEAAVPFRVQGFDTSYRRRRGSVAEDGPQARPQATAGVAGLITLDSYSHVLPGMDALAADAVARLIFGDGAANEGNPEGGR